MASNATNNQLTRAEVDFFVENGYLGPYTAMPPAEMAAVRRQVEAQVLTSDGPNPRSRGQSRHMDQPVVYDLVTHPAIIDRIAGILGPGPGHLGHQFLEQSARRRRNPLAPGYQLLAPGAAAQHLRLDRYRRSHDREFLRTDYPRLTSTVAAAHQSRGRHGLRRNGRPRRL